MYLFLGIEVPFHCIISCTYLLSLGYFALLYISWYDMLQVHCDLTDISLLFSLHISDAAVEYLQR